MLRPFDFLMVCAMLAAATVTYKIKHHTDNKAAEVRRLEAEIKLEKDTIDLLKADEALLTQPNRLERLVTTYAAELQLVPTDPSQLARPSRSRWPTSSRTRAPRCRTCTGSRARARCKRPP